MVPVIVTRHRGQLLVVRQPDHGLQAGSFARAWGNDEVPDLEDHRRSAELAATHHDDGWAVWERRPGIEHATGLPVPFYALSPLEHVPLYRAGIERAAQFDAFAGLLVSMHGAGLYNGRYGTFTLAEQHFDAEEQSLVDEFLADMADLQARLGRLLGLAAEERHVSADPQVLYDYLLVQVWDRLSLQFAHFLAADGVIAPLPHPDGTTGELACREVGPFALELDPYPFADDELAFPVPVSVVPDRRYRAPEDFLEQLAAAGQTSLECRVRRPRGAGSG